MEQRSRSLAGSFLGAVCVFAIIAGTQCGSAEGKEVPKPAKDGLFYMWLFDEGHAGHQFSTAYDTDDYWTEEYKTNFFQDTFKGNFAYPEGVSGTCGKFDGFTTRIVRTYIKVPDLTEGFSIEGWIAPQSTRQAAIMAQEKDFKQGFIFGLFRGRLAIQMAVGGEWVECIARKPVPVRQWTHVAVTFKSDEGVRLYMNGANVGSLEATGTMTDARMQDLLIGMSQPKEMSFPEYGSKFPPIDKKVHYHMAYDGLIDELKLYEEALSPDDVKEVANEHKPTGDPPLERRTRPVPPALDNPTFGASCCKIPYYDEYEAVQRIGDYADILVRFDLSPVSFMFVHTNTYIPQWVTENGKLMSDQSVEINAKTGYGEVMMDKQNRYSHVRLIENSEARVVVHWRYALCDRFYSIARPDEITNWGDWADEYFTIYPDNVTVRHWIYYTSTFGEDYLQFQETILHPQPGHTCDDDVETEALTLANMNGETHTYSWAEGVPPYFPKPEAANIQLVNMKSQYRPYIIFEPGSRIDKYIWGYRKGGRARVSGCLASGLPVIHKGKDRDSYVAVALYGMTHNQIADLLPLANSWVNPPELRVTSSGYQSEGYDRFQRAYVICCQEVGKPSSLEFTLEPGDGSPVLNPAFVVRNWGDGGACLKIDGNSVERGKSFRFGHRNTLEGTDLIVWIEKESTKPVRFSLTRNVGFN